jgi:leader peptidase (prepilin peptidase)/N-methyltransferase
MSATDALRAAGGAVVVVAYVGFALLSVLLAIVDARTHRLPDRLVLPAYPILLGLLAAASGLREDWAGLGRAIIAGGVLFALFLLLRLAYPGGMGGGDVKLAGVIGIMLGYVGWTSVGVGVFAAFLLGGVYSLLLIAQRRAQRTTAVPFGPWLLLGAWIGIAVHLIAR